ncbi:HlyD family efflux transporter periplasmic adaptor subunit [Clostridium sp. Marseille-Q2269]|uniref:efflux RND transporter periplasmic adaptor subunit n=1 Tax=Clostridium sp. Marseille-Q2269 TaxID=2942205 RepID=UPI002073AE4E|nr:HlyD family efflux transporter periplasmic adaptor subunit [Clostridium sp. Marseille-Q2269]
MKKKRVIIVSLIIVVTISLIGFTVITINKLKNNTKNNAKKVSLYTVKEAPNVFFEGEIKSSKSVVLQADTAKGTVDKINVKDKQMVKAGDILFSYKNNQFIDQKNDLEYELDTLKDKYNKTKKELNSVSDKANQVQEQQKQQKQREQEQQKQEIQKQKGQEQKTEEQKVSILQNKDKQEQIDTADLEQQKVLAEKSKDELQSELNDNIKQQNHLNDKIKNINDKCNVYIKAPFDGVVKIGGYSEIEPSKPILTLDSENMQVVCGVSEKDILKLTEEQTVKVSILGTGQSINGKIKNIDKKPSPEVTISQGAIQQGSGSQSSSPKLSTINSYEVIIQIDNIKDICSGFHVQVSTKAKNYIPKIPKTAIFKNKDKSYVWVVKDRFLKKKKIEASDWNDKYIQIKNGVNFNDKIVREVKDTMKEGDKVE